jgi:hypothetical protein
MENAAGRGPGSARALTVMLLIGTCKKIGPAIRHCPPIGDRKNA